MKEQMEFIKLETKPLRKFDLDEKWLQVQIIANPEILGLGDEIFLRDKERRQPNAGRLDLLFETNDNSKRYEVEILLGPTDASHIIRTIEYWDIERKRYPKYEHCAVIVAEDITSRFFNVISLLNGQIPIIALKLTAIQQGDNGVGLIFTKVLDEMTQEEEEFELALPVDEEYWVSKKGQAQVDIAKSACDMFAVTPYYTKGYMGINFQSKKNAKVRIELKKREIEFRFYMSKREDIDEKVDDYWRGSYRLRIQNKEELNAQADILKELFALAVGQQPDLDAQKNDNSAKN